MTPSNPPVLKAKQISFLILSGLVGAILVLICTSRYGAGISPDSVGYIAVARNLVAGKGAVDYTGSYFVIQPPLYPVLLGLFGVDPLRIAHIINAVIMGLIVSLAGVMFFRHLGQTIFAVIGVGAILISRPLIDVSVWAWSEPLFICCVLLFLLWAESYLVTRNIIFLVLLSVVTILASLTRYIGVTLIGSGLLVTVFLCRTTPRVKTLHSSLFVLLSTAPFGLWMLRNYALSGTFFGPRLPSGYTVVDNVIFTIRAVFSWFVPEGVLKYPFALVGLSLAAIIVFGMVLAYLARCLSRVDRQRLRAIIPQLGPTVVFNAVYTVAMEISSATTAYDPINYRLVSPLYVPTIVLVLSFVQKLAEPMERLFSKKDITRSLIVLSVILLFPALASNIGISRLRITQRAGMYNTDRWQHSETVLYLRSHALDSHYPVYSNSADALYILTTVDARMSPAKTAYNSPERLNTLSDLGGSWPEARTAYLVWFDNLGRDFLFTFDELEAVVDVQSCDHFSDGTICLVSRRN